MEFETLPAAVFNYINELTKRCQELESSLKQYEINYKLLDEKYQLLLFYRFSRSSERYRADINQPLLFTEESGTEAIKPKYQDHIPYYRQEYQFHRIGVELSRQDMSNWQQQVFNRLSPLFTLLKETVKSGPVLQMDETTVQVMREEGREDTQKSYMWLARGGPPGKRVIWYEYHQTRGAEHAKTFLEGFSGYLQTDGYESYDAAVAGRDDIKHAGCFAHARRKFFEATT